MNIKLPSVCRKKRIPEISAECFAVYAYLAGLAVILIDLSLHTTMFYKLLGDHTQLHIFERIYMLAVILLKLSLSGKQDWKKSVLIGAAVACFLAAYYRRSHYEELLVFVFVLVGADRVDFRKILYVYIITAAGVTAAAAAAAGLGIIENLVYHQNGRGTRISFGSTYPTDFSAHLVYLILAYACLRKNRLHTAEYAVFVAAAVFVYVFCGARTNAGCILIFTAGCILMRRMRGTEMAARKRTGLFSWCTAERLLAASAVILAALMIVMVVFYQKDSAVMAKIDRSLFTTRISQSRTGLDQYGISFFGQYIEMHGFGGKTERPENYFFIDSSYIKILLCYGVFVFAYVMGAYYLIGQAARKRRDFFMLLILGVIGIQCLYEHHMLELAFNPFSLALFADMGAEERERRQYE